MLIFLIGSESLSMLRCITVTLHAHVYYKLMLCIVFMEVSGGKLTKYISGEKRRRRKKKTNKLFNRLPDGQLHLFS